MKEKEVRDEKPNKEEHTGSSSYVRVPQWSSRACRKRDSPPEEAEFPGSSTAWLRDMPFEKSQWVPPQQLYCQLHLAFRHKPRSAPESQDFQQAVVVFRCLGYGSAMMGRRAAGRLPLQAGVPPRWRWVRYLQLCQRGWLAGGQSFPLLHRRSFALAAWKVERTKE